MLKIPFPLHRRPQVQSGLRFAAMVDLAFALKLNVDHPERFGFRDHPTPRRQSARAQEVRIMQVLYTAEATAVGGRGGHVRSSDGVLDLSLAHPKELGGPGGEATNPEQLFAAGYAACFTSALLRVARERKAPLKESSVTARVGIGRDERNRFKLQVAMEISGAWPRPG